MKYLLTILATIISFHSFSCQCDPPLDKAGIDQMIAEADIVVEGVFISSIHQINEIREDDNQKQEGFNILLKVTKVIKGNFMNDTIAINQWGYGNCTHTFTKDGKYIVYGYEIKGFKSKQKEYYKSQSSKSKDTIPPPPPDDLLDNKGIWTSYYYDKTATDYWQKILKSYRVFTTSACSTFSANSIVGQMTKN